MWKKYMGSQEIKEGREEGQVYYYLFRKRYGVYGILIALYRQSKGLQWDMAEGIAEEESEAKQIVNCCKEYCVTPVSMPESLDEILFGSGILFQKAKK